MNVRPVNPGFLRHAVRKCEGPWQHRLHSIHSFIDLGLYFQRCGNDVVTFALRLQPRHLQILRGQREAEERLAMMLLLNVRTAFEPEKLTLEFVKETVQSIRSWRFRNNIPQLDLDASFSALGKMGLFCPGSDDCQRIRDHLLADEENSYKYRWKHIAPSLAPCVSHKELKETMDFEELKKAFPDYKLMHWARRELPYYDLMAHVMLFRRDCLSTLHYYIETGELQATQFRIQAIVHEIAERENLHDQLQGMSQASA